MRGNRPGASLWLPLAAASILIAAAAQAQEAVLISCPAPNAACTCQRVFATTLTGKDSVKLVPPSAAANPQLLRKGTSVKLRALAGLVREPRTGVLRALGPAGDLTDVVLPSKMPQGATTAAAAAAGSSVEYRTDAASKTRVTVPMDQFVALLYGPRFDDHVVEFLKKEVQASEPHPRHDGLVAGAIAFASKSAALQAWREGLRTAMRESLAAFRSELGDPALLEAKLAGGLAAMRAYRLVALDAQKEEALQEDLIAEHRRLAERFATASAFKNAGMHDAYLEVLDQVGLARWSRPELLEGIDGALRASAQYHLNRGRELRAAKRFAQAFDEARLAHDRAPCDETAGSFYYESRVEFVNRNAIPASPEYDKEGRNILQQMVRDIQGIPQTDLTPERVAYVRKRIEEGLARDEGYLPLQLKKAEFLMNVGELIDARNVVTRTEREVKLGRSDAEEWLSLDARINRELIAIRQKTERLAQEHIDNDRFLEAVVAAESGLKAEPENKRLLYLAAVASGVRRDALRAREYVQRYLRANTLACRAEPEVVQTLFELYRSDAPAADVARADGRLPNWVSGEPYYPGEVAYDPVSGTFQQHVLVSQVNKGQQLTNTEFRWDGFRAGAITTMVGARPGDPVRRDRTTLVIEPAYDQKRVYMKGVGTAANSAGERQVTPLKYLNCPDYDPQLAAKFTGRFSARGWAGNPFFHPFLWEDIYLFDLAYDELGRLKTATPVPDATTHRSSPLSETLTFAWDGRTKRLLAIHGPTYRRELIYDKQGRLLMEKITQGKGDGKIEYRYEGKSPVPVQATCEDDFYDKSRRLISLDARDR